MRNYRHAVVTFKMVTGYLETRGELMEKGAIVLGIDGASWTLIKRFLEYGELRELKYIVKNGTHGNLRSCIPPITLPAWASMLTGKNPGKIGAIHFVMREENSYKFKPVILINLEKENPLWKILNMFEMYTALLYIPTIIPNLRYYRGVYIPGEFVFRDVSPYPHSIEKIISDFGLNEEPPSFNSVNPEQYIKWWTKNTEKHLKLLLYLLKKYKYDKSPLTLLFYVIYSNDHLSHLYWRYIDPSHPEYEENKLIEDAFIEYYRTIDKFIGKIVNYIENRDITLFIVSDHGHGPLIKRINLNKWLEQNGYLRYKLTGKIKSYLRNIVRRYILASAVKFNFLRKISKKLGIHVKQGNVFIFDTDIIDWKRTLAYFSGYNSININLKGREPYGIVDTKMYSILVRDIMNNLRKLKDPETTNHVIQYIWFRDNIYNGPYINAMPDIIIEYRNESFYESVYTALDNIILEEVFYKPNNPPVSSAHTYNGIFIAYGANIAPNKVIHLSIYDIAPTLLYMYGLPIPSDVDGTVVQRIFKEDFVKKMGNPIFKNPAYFRRFEIKSKVRDVLFQR